MSIQPEINQKKLILSTTEVSKLLLSKGRRKINESNASHGLKAMNNIDLSDLTSQINIKLSKEGENQNTTNIADQSMFKHLGDKSIFIKQRATINPLDRSGFFNHKDNNNFLSKLDKSQLVMGIEGLGDRIMEDFYNMHFIHNFVDIYKLKDHREDLIELEGFGNKSVDNLIEAIETSKSNSLEKLIFALGIPNVGEKTAKILAKHYKTLDNLMNASVEELSSIYDIGEIIARSIVDYFEDTINHDVIDALLMEGINTKYLGEEVQEDTDFVGKTFVVTGTLETLTRDEAKESIELRGGKTSSSVSKKTDVVVVGENPGSKYDKAVNLNIEIWNEEEFLKKLNK